MPIARPAITSREKAKTVRAYAVKVPFTVSEHHRPPSFLGRCVACVIEKKPSPLHPGDGFSPCPARQATDSGSDRSVSVKAVSSDVIPSSALSVAARSSYWKHPWWSG
jgi:hypothetical protein